MDRENAQQFFQGRGAGCDVKQAIIKYRPHTLRPGKRLYRITIGLIQNELADGWLHRKKLGDGEATSKAGTLTRGAGASGMVISNADDA